MDASIEMKAVALEKLIAARKDLLQQQYKLNAYCSALEEGSILIYSTKAVSYTHLTLPTS